MNPLDQANTRFNFAGTNARVQARNGKDGPIYRVSFEVDQPTGEQFMAANLVGKIYGGQLMLIDPDLGDPTTPEPEHPIKGGSVSRDAALLCKDHRFQRYAALHTGHEVSETAAIHYLKNQCGIQSRKELDHDQNALHQFIQLHRNYGTWCKEQR